MAVDTNIALTTLETVKDELGITDASSDNFLSRKINAVSQKIANYCNRNFRKQTYTNEKYEGTDDLELNLNNYPITDLTEVLLNENTIDVSEIEIDENPGILYFENIFKSIGYVSGISRHRDLRTKNITVTFEAGYQLPDQVDRDLPYDLEEAVIEEIKYLYGLKDSNGRKVSSWSLDKASKDFEDSEKEYSKENGMLFSTIAILDSTYRRYLI